MCRDFQNAISYLLYFFFFPYEELRFFFKAVGIWNKSSFKEP